MTARIANEVTVSSFISNAAAGKSIVYYIGHVLPAEERDSVRMIRRAYNDGVVELMQRRRDDGLFDYIAQKRRWVRPIEGGCGFLHLRTGKDA